MVTLFGCRANEERLIDLGLTSYEAKAYLALLRRDSSTPADVARLARVPRQRIYDVLATLVQKGLVSQRPGPPAKYSAAAPDFAIERLLLRRREELAELERNSREMIEALTPDIRGGPEGARSARIHRGAPRPARDQRALRRAAGRRSSDEILVFTKPPYAKPAQENVEGIAVTPEPHARAASTSSRRSTTPTSPPASAASSRPARRRGSCEKLPLKLVIIDETIVMFGMEDPVAGSTQLTLAVVEHRALAQLLKIAFDAVWDAGRHDRRGSGSGRRASACNSPSPRGWLLERDRRPSGALWPTGLICQSTPCLTPRQVVISFHH